MRRAVLLAAALLLAPARGHAQEDPCGAQPSLTGCAAAHQALASAAAQFGMAAAAGAPVPGVEGTRGVTLGLIPRTTATLRLSAAAVHLPDLARPGHTATSTPLALRLETATQLYSGNAAGTGAIDLLLESGILANSGEGGRTAASFGAGARLGLLRESFSTPGVALSGVLRHTGPLRYGSRCVDVTFCGGRAGEARFGVLDLAARVTAGKRVGPLGLLAGAGWDRFSSTHGSFSYQGSNGFESASGSAEVAVHQGRWSGFVNLSRGLTVGSLVAEAGWMSGGDAVSGYAPSAGDNRPGRGTLFGSLSLRVAL